MAEDLVDVLVLGAGPAGLGLAAAASRAGFTVLLLAPNPERPWHCTYCTWLHELDSSWIQALLQPGEQVFDCRWERSIATLGDGSEVTLGQGYGRIDSGVLRGAFLRACERHGARVVRGSACQVDHYADWSEVRTTGGIVHRGRIVVDASGHYTTFLEYAAGPKRRWQSFVGEQLQCAEPHGFPVDTAVIFDWRDAPGGTKLDAITPPSFAYVLPLDERTLFVEETVLIADQKVPLDVLAARLETRKFHLGLQRATVIPEGRECYSFPMGGALPVEGQRVLGLGAAGRMVHPATGFSVAYTLALVPGLVEQLQSGFLANQTPDQLSAACWATLWPPDRRRLHVIYSMGSDVLVALDRAHLTLFFRAFFQLPVGRWSCFMTRENTTRELAQAMLEIFFTGAMSIKATLVSTAMIHGGLPLFAALAGGVLSPKAYIDAQGPRKYFLVVLGIIFNLLVVLKVLYPSFMATEP